jgi:UDP-N-acetylglucosamine--N-acetylmuramyl-(pentapeptide) pyrophosphoryl-undecaprenol N-acetylglucosamine transferase
MKVMIMAGGTGGHVFPALAVASHLRAGGASVVWMGTRAGIESRLVPASGYTAEWISVSGLRRKGVASWLTAPLKLLRALGEALAALRRQRPSVVLGMVGFASGPGGLAAWLLRLPLVIHEQNAAAGLTNRLLARLASCVLEAFSGTFPARCNARAVGNPVRQEILELPAREQRTGALHLLVLGGSQGALALNETVPAALKLLSPKAHPQVRHQAGRTLEAARRAYGEVPDSVQISGFIDDMAAAYAWADLVVCRAGALTVAELAAAGLPAILVPYPPAVDDHQTRNGHYLESACAAIMIQQRDFTPEKLAGLLRDFDADRSRLTAMGRAAHKCAWPHATAQIAACCKASAREAAA